MPKVICDKFSNYSDPKTKVHFTPLLDRRTGCFIGFAQVSRELAEGYAKRDGFQVISDTEYLAITSIPDPEPLADPSGDPLTDAAAIRQAHRRRAQPEKKPADAPNPEPLADPSGEGDPNPDPASDESQAEDDGPPPPPESK